MRAHVCPCETMCTYVRLCVPMCTHMRLRVPMWDYVCLCVDVCAYADGTDMGHADRLPGPSGQCIVAGYNEPRGISCAIRNFAVQQVVSVS